MQLRTLASAGRTGALALVLVACGGGTEPTASEQRLTPSATLTEAPPSVATSASEAPPATATAEPSSKPSPSVSASASSGFGPQEFTVAPHAEADALFATRDRCRNPRDSYELEFPDEWYTNTEIRDVPACSWFAPVFYTVDDFDDRPDEIAIEILWVPGDRGYHGDFLSREDGLVGGQYATRLEVTGTADTPGDGTSYEYVVQLGPTPEEGPNLIVRTDTAMAGDYELNKAVLDRIMATMEFLGSVQ